MFFSINAQQMFVNDLCCPLIEFYTAIANQDEQFFSTIQELTDLWVKCEKMVSPDWSDLSDLDKKLDLKDIPPNIQKIIQKHFFDKVKRMRRIESKIGNFSIEDRLKNLETGLKAGVYMHVRDLYNTCCTPATFFFIRDYCYSCMFRYNSKGEFNVAYGGITYNARKPNVKVNHWRSPDVVQHLRSSIMTSMDFEDFLNLYAFGRTDFIFADPPYDSDFNSYARNIFDHNDQERLANVLLNTKAKFLLIIKKTPLICNLYKEMNVFPFGKRYRVSFKNRNDQDAEHLCITNY